MSTTLPVSKFYLCSTVCGAAIGVASTASTEHSSGHLSDFDLESPSVTEGLSHMKHHLHLEFDDDVMENLLVLRHAFGVKSVTDVIRRSIAVANFATEQAVTSDYVIVMRGDKQAPEEGIRILLRA